METGYAMQRAVHRLVLAVAIAAAAWIGAYAAAQAVFDIELDGSRRGEIPTEEIEHVYALDLPAGVANVTIWVDAYGADADLAVTFVPDGEQLFHDISTDPYPTFTMTAPRAGRYEIAVLNLLWQPLRYELHVTSGSGWERTGGAGAGGAGPVTMPSVTVIPELVEPGQQVQVGFSGAPGNARDWLGLYRQEAGDRQYLTYQYVYGEERGMRAFTAPNEPGRYQFRLFANDGYTQVAQSTVFEVRAPVATGVALAAGAPAAAGRLELSARLVPGGASVDVRFAHAPGNQRDWIGLYREGAGDRAYLGYQYTLGASSGSLVFELPDEPGRFEFRLFENDGYTRVAVSDTVVVQAALAVSGTPIGCDRFANQSPMAELGTGESLTLTCPSGCGVSGRLWGTGIYTDDSQVCLAARHAGAVGEHGGTFVLTALAGQERYPGSTRHGVTSAGWTAWRRSFTIKTLADDAPLAAGTPAAEPHVLSGNWRHVANRSEGTLRFAFAPGGWQGTQQLAGSAALDAIEFDGEVLRFVVPAGVNTQRYVGSLTVSEDAYAFVGTFTQDNSGDRAYPWSAERPR
jgi:hypothetical protein